MPDMNASTIGKKTHKTYQAQAKIKQAKIEYHLNYSRPMNSAPTHIPYCTTEPEKGEISNKPKSF